VGDILHIPAALAAHGYIFLFGWVTAEVLGAPLPAVPILLAAGVLSATGRLSFSTAWAFGVLACTVGDVTWYGIGTRWGRRVLRQFGSRVSFGPDSCAGRASDFVQRYGTRTMLVAKFLPGVNTFAVPLAAASGIALPVFFLYEIPGNIVYIGAWLFLGRMIGQRIETLSLLAHFATRVAIGVALLGAMALVVFRYAQGRRLRRQIRNACIAPQELYELIRRGNEPLIVDLRHPLDMFTDPRMIPGAIRLTPDELPAQGLDLPRDRDIILYCTCPNEASSVSTALRLRKMGITRVRPLIGGFDVWKRLGYPLEEATDRIGWRADAGAESDIRTPKHYFAMDGKTKVRRVRTL
jgi:membrane protein DedA with SNARE-associated domain/rhodanese-related sulfurtransferase